MLDVHAHFLPALDDGVKTLEEAVTVLKGLKALGFSHIVATPHFYPGRYTPSADSIDVTLAAVRETLKREEVEIEIIRGRECFFDFALTTSPERETFPFEWNRRRYQLIEIPNTTQAAIMAPYIQGLIRSGVTPILAHAERYERIIADPKRIEEFIQIGFRIQIDLLSFHPTAAEPVRKTAIQLLEENRIDLVASDIHKASQLDRISESIEFIKKEYGQKRLDRYCTLS